MNWLLVLEIAVGIAIGIIVSVALIELTCCIVDTVKNRKKEKSEDLLNPDNVTFIIEKDKLTKIAKGAAFALLGVALILLS